MDFGLAERQVFRNFPVRQQVAGTQKYQNSSVDLALGKDIEECGSRCWWEESKSVRGRLGRVVLRATVPPVGLREGDDWSAVLGGC